MDILQIKNAIETYNLKSGSYMEEFLNFDFQGFFKTENQLTSLIAYGVMKDDAPLTVNPITTFNLFQTTHKYIQAQLTKFYTDAYKVSNLLEMMNCLESIPEKYHCLLNWKPNALQLELAKKVLTEYETFSVYGKERLSAYAEDYLDAVLAKSLPSINEENLQGFIGLGFLSEEKFESFKEKGLIKDGPQLEKVYQALGMELPVYKSFQGVKAVGTSFKTLEGVDRQDLLKELNETQESVALELKPYIFKKEGQPDKQAVAIYWNDKDLANLSQATVDALYSQMDAPEFTLHSYEVTGGYSATASYGLKLDFDVTGKTKVQQEVQDALIVNNPLCL